MKIPVINTDLKKYFLQYLTIVNPIALRLSPMQLKVLAGILYWNNELKQYPLNIRNSLLFSAATRKLIRGIVMDKANKAIDEHNFNNIVKELRAKNIIVGKGSETSINPVYIIYPEKDNLLTINWNIK
jgi:hypothetical protein